MNSNAPSLSLKTLTSATFFGSFILATLDAQAAVSQAPLSLLEGVSPNILVTLDDSGSMAWDYAPDDRATWSSRARKSNQTNSMYYNPNINYELPYTITLVSGNEVISRYSAPADYTRVPSDGFNDTSNKVSLFEITDVCVEWHWLFGCTKKEKQETNNFLYYNYNTSASCPENPTSSPDDSCFTEVRITDAQQRRNFAIWYSFYRTRNLATRSAANIAFYSVPSSVRLTWGALTTCPIGAGDSGDQSYFDAVNGKWRTANCYTNKMGEFHTAHKQNFYTWLKNFPANGATPLHTALDRAGKFLKDNPAAYTENGKTFSCRPSYHVFMTDGLWNGRNTSNHPTKNLNTDEALEYPYKDSHADTLADLAYYYWKTDLRTDLKNNVPTYIPYKNGNTDITTNDPRNNPADWQHLVNFMVGLGLSNSLNNSTAPTWGGNTFSNYNELMAMGSNGKRWPEVKDAVSGVQATDNVYDLWHSAINSRGEFFSADSPQSMVQAFNDILARIAQRKSTAAKPAVNSGQIIEDVTDGTKVVTTSYQTSYSSEENWAGDLTRSDKELKFNPTTATYDETFTQKWSAKEKLPNADRREIYIKGTNTSSLQAFSWSNAGDSSISGTLAYLLSRDPENNNTPDTKGEARLNYLRGIRTDEGTTFRARTSVLGDLYSSSPVAVSKARYLTSFANRLEGNTAYTTFAESMANRKAMVYVGGNDGMLHGFNADTGVEEFAFIPSAVFDKLNKYTGKNYSHEFYVDGSPVVADVYDGTSWRTILVGTLRAGGKSVFALDITTPGSEKLLWEFDDSKLTGTNAVKMGYSFSKPTVARLANPSATQRGSWAVVFGNGYEAANHTNGKAALFILDALTGDLLTADNKGLEVTGTNGVANGLSTPKLSDYNADGIAEFAYAGDLQGNLWRFDLNPSKFAVAYGDKPLFSAVSSDTSKKPQPITAAPSLVAHPSGIGHLVIFGTGKYFEETDKNGDKTIAQTLYGIWDSKTKPTDTTSAITITRSNLVTQNIVTEQTAVDSNNQSSAARTISDNEIAWFVSDANGVSTINKYGWALDLKVGSTLDGEMVIEDMAKLGSTVFFQSLVPNNDPCADGASSWIYAINPATGGKTSHHAFDLRFTAADKANDVISGRKEGGEGGITISQKPDGSFELNSGGKSFAVFPARSSLGRQTWRPIEEQ